MKKSVLLLLLLVTTIAAQAATDYNFYVGGVRVTSDNCSNITGSNITSGTAVFTPSDNTLTLTNVTISRTGTDNRAIQSDRAGLIIKLVGTNRLSAASSSVIRFNQSGSIVVASGTTTVTGGTEGGVYSNNASVTVMGPGKLIVKSTNDKYGFEGKGTSSNSTLIFRNATVEASGKKGAIYDWASVNFYANSHITLKATNDSNYPIAWNIEDLNTWDTEAFLAPWGVTFNTSSKCITYQGSPLYDKDIFISDDYGLLLKYSNFPDENFRNYLLSLYPKGYLTKEELEARTSLYVNGQGINFLSGIQLFTSLVVLDCSNNNLTSLNLTGLNNLMSLRCLNNKFTTLTVSGLPKLTTMNASDNTLLTTLRCNNNILTDLYVNGCTQLQEIDCSGNNFTSLDVSQCTQLKVLTCNNNQIQRLYLDGCSQLETLNCQYNNLITYTVTGKTKLKNLYIDHNEFLNTLKCNNNALTNFTFSGCSSLQYLDCHGNALTAIPASTCAPQLRYLYCQNNALTFISAPDDLQTLDCSNNRLSELNLMNLSMLASLKVAGNTSLTTLKCNNDALTMLDVTGCTQLQRLYCQMNQLTSLDVSTCTQLKELKCYRNNIGQTAMTTLVNGLVNRNSTTAGILDVLHSSEEQNVFDNTHVINARAKNWIPYRYSNSSWVEIEAALIGDVNGDGSISISDVTALIDLLLSNGNLPATADVNADGGVSISDATALIDMLLSAH